MPDRLARGLSFWVTLALVTGLTLAYLVAAAILPSLPSLSAAGRLGLELAFGAGFIAAVIALCIRWWHGVDEAQREAWKWAWYWGSTFGLAAHATGDVKQGEVGGATIGIVRTNFDAAISLEVDGLPAGTTATIDPSPTTDDTAALKVATQAGVTPTGSYRLTITGTALGLSRQAYLSLVVADGVPPTLTAPSVGLARSTTLGSSIPVRISRPRSKQ